MWFACIVFRDPQDADPTRPDLKELQVSTFTPLQAHAEQDLAADARGSNSSGNGAGR